MDSTLYPTVDWPYLRIWAEADGRGDAVQGAADRLMPWSWTTTLLRLCNLSCRAFRRPGDYIELAWLDQHFNYRLTSDDTLETATYWLAEAITLNQATGGVSATASGTHDRPDLPWLRSGSNGNRIGVYGTVHGAGTELWSPAGRQVHGWRDACKLAGDAGFLGAGGFHGRSGADYERPQNAVDMGARTCRMELTNAASSRWRWRTGWSAARIATIGSRGLAAGGSRTMRTR